MSNLVTSPFAGYRTDVRSEDLREYFVKPEYFDAITADRLPVIVEGERGTGKTTLLKGLTYDYNFDAYKNGQLDYWGIYHKIDKNLVSAFDKLDVTDVEKRLVFGHYISTVLIEKLIESLIIIKNEFSDDEIDMIIQNILSNFFEFDTVIYSLTDLNKYIKNVKYTLFDYLRNGGIVIKKCNEGVVLQEVSETLSKTSFMNGKVVYFLIDECESLTDYQQKVVNSYIKNANMHHTYVLGFKTDGMVDSETSDGDYIRMPDDYNKITVMSNINDEKSKQEYSNFVKQICNLRLEKFRKSLDYGYDNINLDIEMILGSLTIEEEIEYVNSKAKKSTHEKYENEFLSLCECKEYMELRNHIASYKTMSIFQKKYVNFRLEKSKSKSSAVSEAKEIKMFLNSSEKLFNRTHYNNYSVSLLYLIYKDLRVNRVLAGYDKILSISGGVIRYFLEICDDIFRKIDTKDLPDIMKGNSINIETQSDSVYDISKSNAKEICSIPIHGVELDNLARAVCNVFRIYHKTTTVPKIEVNHFEVVNFNNDSNAALVNNILRAGTMWGVFKVFPENKKTTDTTPTLNDKSYMIHPIFTPHYGISYRKKKNMKFAMSSIIVFCNGNSEKIGLLTKQLTKDDSATEDNQMSLMNFEGRY